MCRIYVEKDARNDDCFLFQKLFKECEAIVDGMRKILQVQPDVERGNRRYQDFEPDRLQTFQNVITFHLEMLLKGNPLILNMLRIQKWDSCQLEATQAILLSIGLPLRATMYAYG